MNNQIGKIISCCAIDENGNRIEFGKVDSIEVTSAWHEPGEATITISPNERGELFTIITPEKGEKELNGSIISCRFETAKGIFNENTKIYDYYVNCKPEDCIIKKGTVFKVWNLYEKKVMYSGSSLRCENIVGVVDQRDAEDIVGKSLKVIERIEVAGEKNILPNKKYIKPLALSKIEGQILAERLKENKSVGFTLGTSGVGLGFTMPDGNGIKLNTDASKASIGVMEFKEPLWSDCNLAIDRADNNINILGGNDMNTNMFGNMFKNMKLGKLETNDIKYSMKGIAFKTTDGDYVCYNPDFTFTNVANMVIDMPMFAMPVSKEQIKVGDVISHNDTWVIVNV